MSDEPESNELRNQFNVFLQSAVSGISDLKDAVVSTAKVGRLKLDVTMLKRNRERLLRELGVQTFKAVQEGTLTPDGELKALYDKLAAVQQKISEDESQVDELLFRTELDEDKPSDADEPDAPDADEPIVDATIDEK